MIDWLLSLFRKHTHEWGEWVYDSTGHVWYRKCLSCERTQEEDEQ